MHHLVLSLTKHAFDGQTDGQTDGRTDVEYDFTSDLTGIGDRSVHVYTKQMDCSVSYAVVLLLV